MKIQDGVFFIILAVLLILRKERWSVYAGLISFVMAIPLFSKWIFFTAQRLTWYGAAFIFMGIMYSLFMKEDKI